MTKATKNPIYQFAEKIITGVGGMHDYEKYELATPNFDRDVTTAIWVLKCLANPKCEGSDYMLQLIQDRRQQLEEEANS